MTRPGDRGREGLVEGEGDRPGRTRDRRIEHLIQKRERLNDAVGLPQKRDDVSRRRQSDGLLWRNEVLRAESTHGIHERLHTFEGPLRIGIVHAARDIRPRCGSDQLALAQPDAIQAGGACRLHARPEHLRHEWADRVQHA